MYATEFQTTVTNQYIQIPNFERFQNKEVRVIILDKIQNSTSKIGKNDFINRLINNPKIISSPIQFLSRDEANER